MSTAKASKGLKVLVILGSTRDGRVGERVAKFVVSHLKTAGHDVDLADPLAMDIPLMKNPLQFYPDRNKAPDPVKEYNARVMKADAYVVVTAEYNRMMPPALINLIDHAPPSSYSFKTTGIVSYSMGPGGGGQALMVTRGFMTEMGAVPIPFMFTIGGAHNMIAEDGSCADENILKKTEKFLKQFNWYSAAMKNHREAEPPQWDGNMVSA